MAPGALQIIVIILLVMVLFGTGRIPMIMENVAKGIKSFKKGLKEEDAGEAAVSQTPASTREGEAEDAENKSTTE